MDTPEKVKIIYEISLKGQRKAFRKGLGVSKLQYITCEYQNYMKKLISFTEDGEMILDTRRIPHNYEVIEVAEGDAESVYKIIAIRNKVFDNVLSKEYILKWIRKQGKTRKDKYFKAVMQKEKLEARKNKTKASAGKRALGLLLGISCAVGVIYGIFFKFQYIFSLLKMYTGIVI